MLFHEFTNGDKPVMVLVHGMLTPCQVWMPQIRAFQDRYNIYAVALNAHTEEETSEFISVKAEAELIIAFLQSKKLTTVDVLCGISLGGKIAHEIWKTEKLTIHNLILDGAPLVSCPKIAVNMMKNNYMDIVRKSKIRDERVLENFKKYFLPERYLEIYLKIVDLISEHSVANMVTSVFSGGNMEGVCNQSRILFIHGTKGNEILSKRAAKIMKKYYPDTQVVCFRGDPHCYKMIYQPTEWISVVNSFLGQS